MRAYLSCGCQIEVLAYASVQPKRKTRGFPQGEYCVHKVTCKRCLAQHKPARAPRKRGK